MTEQQRRIAVGAIAGISAAVVAAGGIGAWWAMNFHNPATPPIPNVVQQPTVPSPSPSPSLPVIQQTAQVYWLKDAGNHLEVVPQPLKVATNQPNAVLAAVFNNLLLGATDPTLSSTIPEGTKLRSVLIENDGIHVDLSEEFTTGGGSASMTGRVAQVLYTATTLQSDAKVWIDVEGKPLEVLGGEGLELEQPMTRQSFEENFTL